MYHPVRECVGLWLFDLDITSAQHAPTIRTLQASLISLLEMQRLLRAMNCAKVAYEAACSEVEDKKEHPDFSVGLEGCYVLWYFGTYFRYLPMSPTSPHCDTFPTNPRSYPVGSQIPKTPNTTELVCFFLETL